MKLYRVVPADEMGNGEDHFTFDKWVCSDCHDSKNEEIIDSKCISCDDEVCEECGFPEGRSFYGFTEADIIDEDIMEEEYWQQMNENGEI